MKTSTQITDLLNAAAGNEPARTKEDPMTTQTAPAAEQTYRTIFIVLYRRGEWGSLPASCCFASERAADEFLAQVEKGGGDGNIVERVEIA